LAVVAYLDESGTHNSSTCTVVAGYAGLQEQWLAFEKDWVAVLTKFKVTTIHGVELAAFKRQFKTWDDDRRTELLESIASLVSRHQLLAISACMINQDYDDAYASLPKRIQIDSKYAHCFRCCMVKVGSFVRELLPGAKVHYVLEDGHRNKGDARRLFDLSKKSEVSLSRWPLGDITFAGKVDYGALQLADLLSYSAYRYSTAYLAAGRNHVEAHKNLVTIWGASPHIDVLITREEMERTAHHLEAIVHHRTRKGGRS
jgi:hypothetical protein